jgi:putative glutathione S-transferase
MSNIMSNSESQANKAARQADGEFVRDISTARNHIGDDQFPPEPGRYHLVVAFNW